MIVDAHQHVGELGDSLSWDGRERTSTGIDVDGEVDRRIAIMDAVGVAWAVVREAFGEHDVPSTLLGVTVLGYEDQLVEIEAIAAVVDPR